MALLLILNLFLVALSLVFWTLTPEGPPSVAWVSLMLAMTVVCFVVWGLASGAARRGNWFDPVPLFTLSYLIVFYQVPWCVAAGLEVREYACPFPERINACATMSFMGYALFCCGYLLCIQSRSVRKHRVDKPNLRKTGGCCFTYSDEGLRRATSALLVFCWITLFVFAALVGSAFLMAFTYSAGMNWGSGATYANVVLELAKGMLMTLAGLRAASTRPATFINYCTRYDRRVLLFFVVANAPFFLAGDRGAAILAAFYFVGPYFLLVKPLRKRSFAIAAVTAAVLMVFLGRMRTRDVTKSWMARVSDGREAVRIVSLAPNEAPTMELATSYNCFNAAAEIIPHDYPYGRGRYHWGNFSSAIPFYRQLFPLGQDYVGSASTFFTDYLRNGDMTCGAGSSCLGMIYLDFGVLGIPPSMALLGVLFGYLGWMVRASGRNVVFWQFVFYFALHQGLKMPRADPFLWVQTVAWGGLLFVFFVRPVLLKKGAMRPAKRFGGESVRHFLRRTHGDKKVPLPVYRR